MRRLDDHERDRLVAALGRFAEGRRAMATTFREAALRRPAAALDVHADELLDEAAEFDALVDEYTAAEYIELGPRARVSS